MKCRSSARLAAGRGVGCAVGLQARGVDVAARADVEGHLHDGGKGVSKIRPQISAPWLVVCARMITRVNARHLWWSMYTLFTWRSRVVCMWSDGSWAKRFAAEQLTSNLGCAVVLGVISDSHTGTPSTAGTGTGTAVPGPTPPPRAAPLVLRVLPAPLVLLAPGLPGLAAVLPVASRPSIQENVAHQSARWMLPLCVVPRTAGGSTLSPPATNEVRRTPPSNDVCLPPRSG